MEPVTAMANGVANWLVQTTLDTVTSNLFAAWAARQNLGDDVSALKCELRKAYAVLANAEGRAITHPPLLEMLQELRDAAEDADNLLDELDYFRLRDQVRGTQEATGTIQESSFSRALHATGDTLEHTVNHLKRKFSDCQRSEIGDTLHNLKFDRVKMASRLQKAVELLRSESSGVHTVLLTLPSPPQKRIIAHCLRLPTTQFHPPSEPVVFGRDELRDEVIGMLTSHERLGENAPVLSVLPILGSGGLGKTTFARYVFNDQRVGSNIFQLKIWLCVSLGAFDIVGLTRKMLEHIPKDKNEDDFNENSTDLDQLQSILIKRLNSGSARFFLVLDDLWECTLDEWDLLITPLSCAQARGSVIIVTTRRQNIANMVKTKGSKLLQLPGLQHEFLWCYFKFCIFNEDCCDFDDSKMKEIALKILLRLKGNPLAAKTTGRLLGRHVDINHWNEVLEKPMWKHGANGNDIMSILKLSYEYLDFPLNQCFLYCGMFPDDYEFDSGELLRFWVGQGYIDPAIQAETVELTGHEYLNTLVDHGFFERRKHGERTIYVLHDFLHELARDISSGECLVIHGLWTTKAVPKTIRHVSILTKEMYQYDKYGVVERNESFEKVLIDLKQNLKIEKLRTLMLIGNCDLHLMSTFGSIFQDVNGLRVFLILVGSEIGNSLTSFFPKLLHLRYLKLQVSDWYYRLPESISAYYHMKVLETNTRNASLPNGMCNLLNLWHFIADKDLHSGIENVGCLVHLQELKKFQVRCSDAFKLGQLRNMSNLGGSMAISSLQNTQTVGEAWETKLEGKRLRRLSLSWDMPKDCNIFCNGSLQSEVIESLRPNKCLRELCIHSYMGSTIPKWLGESEYYVCLKSICIRNCLELKELLPFEMLYSLKHLEIDGLKLLRKLEFGTQDYDTIVHARRPLEMLVVKDMQELVTIEIKFFFPSLRELSIAACPKLVEVNFPNSASVEDERFEWFFKLESLEIKDCQQLQTTVPPLPHTSKLRKWNVESVQSIPYSSSKCYMDDLAWSGVMGLKIIDSSLINFHYLKDLKRLKISHCPNLGMWSGLDELHFLKDLEFSNCCLSEVPEEPAWLLPSSIEIFTLSYCQITGEGVSLLLPQLLKLSKLTLQRCLQIQNVVIGDWTVSNINYKHQVATSQSCSLAVDSSNVAGVKANRDCLHIPSNLLTSLQELIIDRCENAVLDGDTPEDIVLSFKRIASLKSLQISECPKFYLKCEGIMPDFPSKLENLELWNVHPMLHKAIDQFNGAPRLQELGLRKCSFSTEAMEGLLVQSYLHLTRLNVWGCEGFTTSWKLAAASAQGLTLPLERLWIDDAGFLTPSICSQLSSTLRYLEISCADQLEMFSEEQEEAFLLLSSLRELFFDCCRNLRSLPQQLHRLTTLQKLDLSDCPKLQSLPPAGLPSTLLVLDVSHCNKRLGVQCENLKGIPSLIVFSNNYEQDQEES